ncbi:tRNA (guanine(9)-N(1))-methyltransferase [Taxawa tesnikishii (nom. ined.)]|nr:tRNA (guanine(9)-N(1))-methyltransferase [Dothideales sp. JES 119]
MGAMEAEERPSKMRKLSHEHATDNATPPALQNSDAQTSLEQSSAGVENGAVNPQLNTGAGADDASKPFVEDSASGPTATAGAQSASEASSGDEPIKPTDIAPLVSTQAANTPDPPLSKSQQKKLRRKAEWEAGRADRKLKRKEKIAEKRERKRAEKEADPEAAAAAAEVKKAAKKLPITFIIDCDFDDLMRDNERISLASQVTRSYSDNKNAHFRSHLTIASFGGKLKERFDGILAKHYESWKGVRFLEEDFVETAKRAQEWMKEDRGGKLVGPVFSKYAEPEVTKAKAKEEGETIYLSSDSDYTLTELKPYSTYIIGGLVDKNREKGVCHKRAVQAGVKTARLPIGDYLDMTSRKVLATNHVNEIMIRYLECGDWGEAFMKVIPKRKGGQLKSKDGVEDDEDEVDDDDDGGVRIPAETTTSVTADEPAAITKGETRAKDGDEDVYNSAI